MLLPTMNKFSQSVVKEVKILFLQLASHSSLNFFYITLSLHTQTTKESFSTDMKMYTSSG
jgi:hypothetical protein